MKKILLLALIVIILALGYAYFYLSKNSFIATAYVAKKACGCHLLAGRSVESIYKQDIDRFPLNLVKISFDKKREIATGSLLGIWSSSVQKTKARGCVLLNNQNEQIQDFDLKHNFQPDSIGYNSALLKEKKLDLAFDLAFDKEGEYEKKTRALLVYHKNTLVREEYSEGFDQNTRILGWSINKSIANTLIGILVRNNKLSLDDDNLFQEWEDDERSKITIDDLLKMSSGLDWDEDYSGKSDATSLLFETYDCGKFAVNQALEAKPGEYWEYSSGTSNILSKIIRQQFKSQEAYLKFPYDSLFTKLGMESMVLDTDQSGNYILSSYGYATPRDWAKFGLMYLNKGKDMNGNQIIPESWVEYSSTPAENAKDKIYGAHFWLNAGGRYPDVPRDLFSCNGFQGQYIFIIPSKDLVVVRMGLSEEEEFDQNGVLKHIVDSVID